MSSRRARGSWRTNVPRLTPSTHQLPPDRELTSGLHAQPVRTIDRPKVAPEDGKVKIRNPQYLGSYNWTNSTTATIIVPGSPPVWRNRPMPYTVKVDAEICFVDQNGYCMPSSPLLPLFKSIDTVAMDDDNDQPDFDWSSVDFVTDRNGLRKLLRWINGTVKDDFRIDTQLAGRRTVLFDRWEKRTRDTPRWTFGRNFERESTTPAPGCELGTGHNRIITYDLNGLKMVVRFKGDACFPPAAPEPTAPASSTIDQMTESLSAVSISSAEAMLVGSSSPISKDTLLIMKGGRKLPQSAIIEIQNRSETSKYPIDWQETYPQLLLSHTTHHFLGIHSRGRFHSCQKRVLGSDIENIVKESSQAQDSLKKLRRALETIQQIVMQGGERGRLSLVCQSGELRVYERSSQTSCLPDDVMERFET